jgi:hypothetical protein
MKKMKHIFTAVLAAALLVCMTAASALAATSTASSGVNWEDNKIQAVGMGIAPTYAHSAAQARILARRAAVVDAYRNLAEQAKGVNIDADTTVENAMVTNDTIHQKMSAFIQGARIVSEKMESDGSYTVTMEVPLFGVSNSLSSTVLEKPAQKESFPEPVASVAPSTASTSVDVHVTIGSGTTPSTGTVTTPATGSSAAAAPSGQAIGGYTGLIVDCRGLGLKPAMSPVIKNANGQAIYGYKNLDYDKVVSGGMAGYTTDMSRATRAGSNPLVVKAVSLDNGANPILSVADANRVLIENGASGFLDATNVVFVR